MLEKHIQFVNQNISFQERMVSKLVDSPTKQKFHGDLLASYVSLRDYLVEQDRKLRESPIPSSGQVKLSLTPTDLEGLPDELLKQLSISDGDRTDFAVLNILEESGGIATLDQLLIGIFKKTGEIIKRQALTSRIYRMSQRELIWSVPGKKGVYSSRKISETEAARIFGENSIEFSA